MSGRKSRNKGKRGERQAAKSLSELLGIELRRGVQYQGSPDSPDVSGLQDHGLHCEVKYDEQTLGKTLYKAMRQSDDDCGERTPFLYGRRNREDWLVVIRSENLIDFCRKVCSIVDEQGIAS